MIVACVGSIVFKKNVHVHTCFYAENCEILAIEDGRRHLGKLKAVLANDEDDAVNKVRGLVRDYLASSCWIKADLKDFTFSFYYSEIDENGQFWQMPSTTNCIQYQAQV
jgi:hypothetical protein